MAGVALAAATVLTGCADGLDTMPGCEADSRLATIAQSVPGAAYVPCISELPTGWSYTSADIDQDGTIISLESDRADRPMEVSLSATCDVGSATPIAPSEEGTRTYQLIESIDPRYSGTFIDVFPGGCIVSSYDFERGAHIALVTELQRTVGLYPRRQLAQELRAEYGITLDP
ncbi:MAG TPA: hypothetical protein VLN74_03590 [Ilumatobacteraceae bacterium]|nr:hypothetical protein [Ilumatobacteraceae bacterium]